ncbi:MAG: hypothetical protein WCC11_00245, partial [Gammaproteobacteria bacterium]
MSGSQALTVNNSGLFTIGGNMNIGSLNQIGTGLSDINANITTTTGGISFAGPVELSTNVTLDSSAADGAVLFGSTVDNAGATAESLTIKSGSGSITFDGAVGAGAHGAIGALSTSSTGSTTFQAAVKAASLTVSGPAAINAASITTSDDQTYGGAVTLGADTTLSSSGNGAIDFASTVDGAHNLSVSTGGVTTFGAAVGSTTALTSLSSSGGGTTTLDGNVSTTGAQIYNDALTLGADVTLTSSGSGAIDFASTVNGAHNLSVSTGGTTTFGAAVGSTTALTSLNSSGGGTTTLDGNVSTTGAQTYSNALLLGGNVTLTSAGGSVLFDNTVDNAGASAENLTVNAIAGAVTFTGAVGGGIHGALAALTSTSATLSVNSLNIGAGGLSLTTSAGPITQGDAFTVAGASIFNAGANAITLTNLSNSFTGAVSLTNSGNNNVQLFDNGALLLGTSSVGSGTLSITAADISETGAATLTQAAGAGIASFTATAATGGINLANANDFTGPVALDNHASSGNLVLSNGGNALILGNVNAGTGTLTVSAAGISQFSGATVTQAAGAGTATFNGGAGVITLANSGNSLTGMVQLNNTGPFAVTLINDGDLTLGGSALGTGAVDIVSTGSITQSGSFTFGGATTLSAAGNLTLNGVLTGGSSLNLDFDQANAGATLDFGSAVINVATLTATSGTGTDIFDLHNAGITAGTFTITGGGGNDTLVGPTAGTYIWNINAANTGKLSFSNLHFTGIGNLIGGAGNDTFAFASGGSLSGTVDGGGGVNTLDYSAFGSAVAVNLSNNSSTAINGGAAGGFSNIEALTGNGAGTTLTGPGGINNWDITGLNAGDINGPGNFSFTQVWNLTGAGSQDTFIFSDGKGVQGVISGGPDGILDYHLYTSAVSVNLGTDTATGTGGISGITSLTGTTSGSNLTTLIGTNANNVWTITGTNAGNLNGSFTFVNVENLTGGSGNDSFVFDNGALVTGIVDGGPGGNNILDFSAYSTAVGITLTGSTVFGYSGSTSGVPNPTGGFAEITQIDEPALSNTLTLANGTPATVTIDSSVPANLFNLTVSVVGAPNLLFTNINTVNGGSGVTNTLISGEGTNNLWTLTSANGGTYNDGQSLIFSNFADLVGGSGNDSFVLAGGSIVSIDGGGGNNT